MGCWNSAHLQRENSYLDSYGGSAVKNPPAIQEMRQEPRVESLGLDLMEKEIEIHFSILVWEISWAEEPGGPQSLWLQRVPLD